MRGRGRVAAASPASSAASHAERRPACAGGWNRIHLGARRDAKRGGIDDPPRTQLRLPGVEPFGTKLTSSNVPATTHKDSHRPT